MFDAERVRQIGLALVMVAFSLATLAACGGSEKAPLPTAILSTGSPAADATIPADATVIELVIKNKQIDPHFVQAKAGKWVVLKITGDGRDHSLEIKTLVPVVQIAAEGVTVIQFQAPEKTGVHSFIMDDKFGGRLRFV